MSLVRAQQGEPKKKPPGSGGFFFNSSSGGLERVCRFRIAKSAAYSRRRQTPWRLPCRRRRAPTGKKPVRRTYSSSSLCKTPSLSAGGKSVVFAKPPSGQARFQRHAPAGLCDMRGARCVCGAAYSRRRRLSCILFYSRVFTFGRIYVILTSESEGYPCAKRI